MHFRNNVEEFAYYLFASRFNPKNIQQESMTITSENRGSTVPDFDIYLRNLILLFEVTASPLMLDVDPKAWQRGILMDVTPQLDNIQWSILYLQHFVTDYGILLIQTCIDELLSGTDAYHTQRELDAYALKNVVYTPIHLVKWNEKYIDTFGYDPRIKKYHL